MAYAYQATVTVPAPVGGPHTDITLLLVGSDPKLRTVANGGQIQNTVTRAYGSYSQVVPADLILSSDMGGSSLYNWGYDYYDPATGLVIIWVKKPSYSAAFSPFVSIGNPTVTTYQGGSIGSEFDGNVKRAYHMGDSGATLTDFSSSRIDATKKSATQPNPTTSGQIDGAQTFVGTISSTDNDYATFSSPTPATNTYTLEAWVNQSSNVDHPTLYYVWASLTGSHVVGFGTTWFPAPVTMKYFDNFNGNAPTAPASFNTGEWHHIVFVRNGDSANYYLDGVAGTAKTGLGTGTQTWVGLGWSGAATTLESIVGTVDEAKFSSTPRSADWIATEYVNQNNPPAMSAFASLGGSVSELSLLGAG